MKQTWQKSSATASILKSQTSFAAVAVGATIDVNGRVTGIVTRHMSIKEDELLKLVAMTRANTGKGKLWICLDNLRLHFSKKLKEYNKKHNIELLFNAPYSSELNPIERLWGFAKRKFSTEIISESSWGNKAEIAALVMRSVLTVEASSLAAHVQKCLVRMETSLRDLNISKAQAV